MSPISEYTGVVPQRTGQDQATFSAAVQSWITFFNAAIPEFNDLAAQLVALLDAQKYNAATTYNVTGYLRPSIVYGSNGITYCCIGNNVVGDNPVGSVSGAWVALTLRSTDLADRTFGEIQGGDITKTADHVLTLAACGCWDSTRAIWLETTTTRTVTIPSVANTLYYLFVVRLAADGSIALRAYTTLGGAAADGAVNAWRLRGVWMTNAATNCKGGFLKKDILYWDLPSENYINAMQVPPNNITTALDISAFIPDLSVVEAIRIGVHGTGTSSAKTAVVGHSSGINSASGFNGYASADTDAAAWGASSTGDGWVPLKTTSIYWGDAESTEATLQCRLLIRAIKMRLDEL